MIYDCIVIGGGPAGMNAALYAKRAGLKTVILEKMFNGGQIINTFEVDNYLGMPKIGGVELAMKMGEHVKAVGVETIMDEVLDIETRERPFKITTKKDEYVTKSIIIATGAKPRKLEVPGEDKFTGRGVSYCATCDGAFYKDKKVIVLGSGNTAIEDAIFLARMAKKVTLISRSSIFKGDETDFNHLKTFDNVEFMNNFSAKEVIGETTLTHLKLENVIDKEEIIIDVDGIFVAVGVIPGSSILDGKIFKCEQGYIITDEYMKTNVEGIFAAGDIRRTVLRQIATSISDGAIAAFYASKSIAKI